MGRTHSWRVESLTRWWPGWRCVGKPHAWGCRQCDRGERLGQPRCFEWRVGLSKCVECDARGRRRRMGVSRRWGRMGQPATAAERVERWLESECTMLYL